MVLRIFKAVYETDTVLLLGLKNQEDDAFRFIYKNLYPIAEKYVVNNGGSKEESKDVFQDCVIALTEKAVNNLVLTSSLNTFFYSMVQNNWRNKLRNKGRLVDLNSQHSVKADDEVVMESEDLMILQLRKEIENLGEQCQRLLNFFYWEKLSMKEIAEKLNYTNAANAKNQKHKCVDQLRKQLKPKTQLL